MYRKTRFPSIWREMDQIQKEMNRLLLSSLSNRAHNPLGFPPINIWTSEEGQIITAEMPGFNPDDIDINVSADTLTLSGERKFDSDNEKIRFHRQERSYGKFSRKIQLPFMIDTEEVQAGFKDGILEIELARAEADKPKKISIKSK